MAQIPARKCGFCNKAVADSYCEGCHQTLCVECRQNVHDKVPFLQDHKITNIQKEGNRVFRPQPVCETHKNQFLYYCSKCECLTCAECMTSSHNEHKTKKIKNVADARRQNVNQIIEQLKTKVETVKKKLETIDTEHSIQIKSDCESYVKTVEDAANNLHTIVDKHKLIPMTTASDFKNIENEELGRKRAFFRSRHDETADRLLKFENLLLETHDSTFLTEWKALQTDVKMNDEETDDPLAAPRRLVSFNQKKLTKSVIDEIDEKFQMKLSIELKEMKIQVSELGNKNEKLNTEINERKEQEFSKLKEHEKKMNKLEKDKTKLKEAIQVKEDEIEKISKLLQGLNVKEIMIKGLQEENSKLTTEYKQREIKAFSQLEEKEKKLNVLSEENKKLKSSIRMNQEELKKMSNEILTYKNSTKNVTKRLEDKIEELESKLKEFMEKENTLQLTTDKGPQYILKGVNTVKESDNQLTDSDLDKSIAEKSTGPSTDMTELKTLQLKKLQFSVLHNLDFISFLHKEIPTCKAELNKNALTFNGTQREVEKKMQTFFDYYIDIECVKHVQGKTSYIPEKMLEFVQRENIREYIDKKFEKEGILCYWYGDEDEGYVKLFTLRGMGSKAVAVVQMCLDSEEFAHTEKVEAILKEKSMVTFLDDQKSYLMLDINDEDLVVVGLESAMRKFITLYHKTHQAVTEIEASNKNREKTALNSNILQHLKKFKSKEVEKFERKWNVTFKQENTAVLIEGETSDVHRAFDSLKDISYIEQKWSCHLDNASDVIKELSSKIIPKLENQFRCSVFTDVNMNCVSHQQLAQWVSQTKDQRIVFVHGSVTDIAADIIVCPVTRHGFGKFENAIVTEGGSEMKRELNEMSRFKEIVISSATGNLHSLMVAYFPVPRFKPGVHLQSEISKGIKDILTEAEKTQLQSIAITTDIGNDIPESTFLHLFLEAYKAQQHKLNSLNQIYLSTESENIFPLLSVLKEGLSNYLRMFDFTAMFEQRYSRVRETRKPADISITLVNGKLVDQKVDIIVNSSNRNLELEKGAVSASILAAGGTEIYAECKQKYPNGIYYGEVIATNPGKLGFKAICHGCLPYWKPIADISCQILAKLVFGCLLHAENYKSERIAFPVFGTGNMLYPWNEVAKTMISTIHKYGRMFPETEMKEVRIVLYDKDCNSIEAFEQEKSKMKEVKLIPEDPIPHPPLILECRCKNVRVKIEPLSSIEFHHCQAIVMIYTYQAALDLERDEPNSTLRRDRIMIERSKIHKFWVISAMVDDDRIQTFTQAIKRALQFSEEKRLSTLAISVMNQPGMSTLKQQATFIRDCVDNMQYVCYLQILKIMPANRDEFDKILVETIHRQEQERRSIQCKVPDWLNVSKTQWKRVKYSETLQSPRLYLTIVGDDDKNMTALLQQLTEEINNLKDD